MARWQIDYTNGLDRASIVGTFADGFCEYINKDVFLTVGADLVTVVIGGVAIYVECRQCLGWVATHPHAELIGGAGFDMTCSNDIKIRLRVRKKQFVLHLYMGYVVHVINYGVKK